MNFGINLINLDHYAKSRLSLSILVLEKQLHEMKSVKMKANKLFLLKRLTYLDHAKLTDMITMIRGENEISIVNNSQTLNFVHNFAHCIVQR